MLLEFLLFLLSLFSFDSVSMISVLDDFVFVFVLSVDDDNFSVIIGGGSIFDFSVSSRFWDIYCDIYQYLITITVDVLRNQ